MPSASRALDRSLARCYASIPDSERKLVTDHDAFGYLARRYDIEIVGAVIPALTTQAQASAGELSDLREVIEREDVAAVFPESSVNSDLADAIAERNRSERRPRPLWRHAGTGRLQRRHLPTEAERANADAITDGLTGQDGGCAR